MRRIVRNSKLRNFHQAKWDEPIIFELSNSGDRGVLVPLAGEEITKEIGDGVSQIPESMQRKTPPGLPEISQARVLRHYLRISQETLGADFNVEIGQGTCTMKYSPKVNEHIARMPEMSELHPLQEESTVQGILEIMYKIDLYLREISGLDRFSLQPSSGGQALMTMASIIRAWHESRGDSEKRDEIITTIYSHPSDAAAAAVKGYKIITVYADKDGYPDLEAFKNAISDRTAGFFVANPEDTGIYNSRVKEFTRLIHEAGGLCCYDQANANGLLGITRARDAGFDMCFFNLHKTFSTPHGCGGPATGAIGVTKELEGFLPVPIVDFGSEGYFLNYSLPNTIGKVRAFYGVPQVALRAYSWIRSLGEEGLREVARVAVLNNNYLLRKVSKIPGASPSYQENPRRVEQVRYSWDKLYKDTGITTEDVQLRMIDFGLHYWTSHHPYIVPQPFTLEPTESTSIEDLDEYIEALEQISSEAYGNQELIKSAPNTSVVHKIDHTVFDDPAQWAITWRSYLKKSK